METEGNKELREKTDSKKNRMWLQTSEDFLEVMSGAFHKLTEKGLVRLVSIFGEVVKTLGGEALLEKGGQWEFASEGSIYLVLSCLLPPVLPGHHRGRAFALLCPSRHDDFLNIGPETIESTVRKPGARINPSAFCRIAQVFITVAKG